MSEQYNYMVCIHCMTYNHKPYILDALNGFAMQQTNFPYVALVIDDASTDGEPDVLRKYIAEQCNATSLVRTETDLYESIQVQSATNPNCLFAFYFLKENQFRTGKKKPIIAEWDAQTKYIAICEGDDYWTDPLKLQKQVDFLEKHEDCVMCCTRAKWLEDGVFTDGFGYQSETNNVIQTGEIIRHDGLINTTSVLYRKGIVSRNDFSWWKIADVGDYPLFIALSLKGKVWFINDITTVYRYNHSGSWTERCKPKLKHIRDTVNWMILLDKETQNEYRNDIYYYIFRLIRKLYLVQETQTKEYISAWLYSGRQIGIIRLLKDILIHYFPILKK